MNTKEKLELLWKYLFLAVIAVGIFRFTSRNNCSMMMGHLGRSAGHDMLFIGDDNHAMDVKVEQEIVDGDTIMTVIVNGEEVDAEKHDMKDGSFNWKSKDGNVMVIDIDDIHDGSSKNGNVKKIIKKKIIVQDKD